MDAVKCITERRSIRSFKPDAVSEELLRSVVETASYAPSWKHSQTARYIAVTGEKKAELAKYTTIWAGIGARIESAPVVMALCSIKSRSGYERDGSPSTVRGDYWQHFDAGIAAEAYCLAAYEKGLGTVILGLFDYDDVAKLLALPENMEVAALIPTGFYEEHPAAPKRKDVNDLLTIIS